MPDIIITEFMDDGPVSDLEKKFTVHRDDTLWEKPDELTALLADASGLIVRNKTQVTAAFLDAAPRLRVVGRLGVGLDNIDVAACEARNIAVCPATGANAAAVAEYVVTAALMLLRGAYSASMDLAAGRWPREALGNGRELGGCTFGIVGFGNIGQETARRAAVFGCTILAHDPVLAADDPAWERAERCSMTDLMAQADIISLHVPLTDRTRNMIGSAALAQMKPGAILINSARGGIVDETALAESIRAGHLGGAALDVFEREPPEPETIEKFAGLRNMILTPHIAGLSTNANARVSRLTVDNVLAALAKSDA
ncbi:MAG: hydroxyacid dehydrogenase [Hyphomicrobiaceae bacterium]